MSSKGERRKWPEYKYTLSFVDCNETLCVALADGIANSAHSGQCLQEVVSVKYFVSDVNEWAKSHPLEAVDCVVYAFGDSLGTFDETNDVQVWPSMQQLLPRLKTRVAERITTDFLGALPVGSCCILDLPSFKFLYVSSQRYIYDTSSSSDGNVPSPYDLLWSAFVSIHQFNSTHGDKIKHIGLMGFGNLLLFQGAMLQRCYRSFIAEESPQHSLPLTFESFGIAADSALSLDCQLGESCYSMTTRSTYSAIDLARLVAHQLLLATEQFLFKEGISFQLLPSSCLS